LVNTQANVLWLSNPAGGRRQYSAAEIDAVRQYVNEGHSILGTFKIFEHAGPPLCDNRALAPIFGLRSDIAYNTSDYGAMQTFSILVPTALFRNLSDPYVSSGFGQAQVPADDLSWDANDLGDAQLLASTADRRGVITQYVTGSYHAIYVSEMVEYYGSSLDTQLLYNALTIPEPSTFVLLAIGTFGLLSHAWRRWQA
jgi:hypothetical protein